MVYALVRPVMITFSCLEDAIYPAQPSDLKCVGSRTETEHTEIDNIAGPIHIGK